MHGGASFTIDLALAGATTSACAGGMSAWSDGSEWRPPAPDEIPVVIAPPYFLDDNHPVLHRGGCTLIGDLRTRSSRATPYGTKLGRFLTVEAGLVLDLTSDRLQHVTLSPEAHAALPVVGGRSAR